jgi:hypothetical protein
MRIKWTSIHSVLAGNPAAPWVGPGLAERLKQERVNSVKKKEKKKIQVTKIGDRSYETPS